VAEAFGKSGYRIGLIARGQDALEETARTLSAMTAWSAADVGKFDELHAAAEELTTALGPPDVWVNAAMGTIFSRFGDVAPAEFARAIETTLLGSVYGLQIALRAMTAQGRGHIIQIGSALAYRAIPLQAPYCAAKHGIRAAVDSLRCELLHDTSPIRVSMVHMPAMNTPQFDWARRHLPHDPQPVPPIYAPEACAEAVLWAAQHPDMREVWVGKPTVQAIIANKLAPAIMDRYMASRAFEGQFERPSTVTDRDGNLFAPVPDFHRTEGRFTKRQIAAVHWIGSSAAREVVMLSFAAVIAVGLVTLSLLFLLKA
jgi:NADP-dependent 3-hydroxy acid dehydrogenase YdfG